MCSCEWGSPCCPIPVEEVGSEDFPILIHDVEIQDEGEGEATMAHGSQVAAGEGEAVAHGSQVAAGEGEAVAHGSQVAAGEGETVLGLLSPELAKLVSVK